MIAPDLTLARHAATYHAGIPTQSSSQATMVGPFHKANGVPAFIASARSSCLEVVYKMSLQKLCNFFQTVTYVALTTGTLKCQQKFNTTISFSNYDAQKIYLGALSYPETAVCDDSFFF